MSVEQLRYNILKETKNKNSEKFNPSYFSALEEEFEDALDFLKTEGYISGGTYGSDGLYKSTYKFLRITEKGEKYLKENSNLSKAYNLFLKAKGLII